MRTRISLPVMACFLLVSAPALLRADEKPALAVEVRVISISAEFFEKYAQLSLRPFPPDQEPFVLKGEGGKFANPIVGMLDVDEGQFNQVLQLATSDRRTTILQAPKLALCEGKPGRLDLTEPVLVATSMTVKRTASDNLAFMPSYERINLGFQMEFEPKRSRDGHSIRLSAKIKQKELMATRVGIDQAAVAAKAAAPNVHFQLPQFGTLYLEKTFTVPEGHTIALGGYERMIEARHESGPPILSRIPYVNRLFKNVGYGREVQSLLILITPRILHPNPPIVEPTSTSGR